MEESVFISYRRDDSAAEAGALYRALCQQVGEDSIFMDTSSTELGARWPDKIKNALMDAATVVVVIGPSWLKSNDEWGRRRIDNETDWVRQEIALTLKQPKLLIPVLVRGAKLPPADALPTDLQEMLTRQSVEIRRDYWDHDIKLLLAQVIKKESRGNDSKAALGPYPVNPPIGPEPISDDRLTSILKLELKEWKRIASPLPEDPSKVREEIVREFKFKSFQDVIKFMSAVAPGCDIAMHHPRWENIWKTLKVYLNTWDIGHKISDRDIQLARYFDRAYSEFAGKAKSSPMTESKI